MGYTSPLARAPFDRQRDTYKLAILGNADCRRMFNEFAAEAPAQARIVIADVESEKRQTGKITRRIDKRLTKAEMVTKARKQAKPKLTKGQRRELDAVLNARPDPMLPDFFALKRAFRNHPDPVMRELARKAHL